MQISISLSHLQLNELKIDLAYALNESIKCQFAFIRLSLYWDEIEKKPRTYDFSIIKKFLNFYQKNQQGVILTVGVKAQRWPEYYWPEFVENKNFHSHETQKLLLGFIKKSITELKKYTCIQYWQLENEPLDPSGPNQDIIPLDFLQQEVELIKNIDQRAIIISVWGNEIIKRNLLDKLTNITNNIGLDFYYKQFVSEIFGKSIYLRPLQSHKELKKYLNKFPNLNFWITELQAEPWERNAEAYFSDHPKSISPQQLLKNFKQASLLGMDKIIFWGFEYWLWKKINGDDSYFKLIKEIKNS